MMMAHVWMILVAFGLSLLTSGVVIKAKGQDGVLEFYEIGPGTGIVKTGDVRGRCKIDPQTTNVNSSCLQIRHGEKFQLGRSHIQVKSEKEIEFVVPDMRKELYGFWYCVAKCGSVVEQIAHTYIHVIDDFLEVTNLNVTVDNWGDIHYTLQPSIEEQRNHVHGHDKSTKVEVNCAIYLNDTCAAMCDGGYCVPEPTVTYECAGSNENCQYPRKTRCSMITVVLWVNETYQTTVFYRKLGDYVKPSPASGLQATHVNSTTAKITWARDGMWTDDNGLRVKYDVTARALNLNHEVTMENLKTETAYLELLPHGVYSISVVVRPQHSGYPSSPAYTTVTMPTDVPASNPFIIGYDIDEKGNVTVFWKNPPEEETNGPIDIVVERDGTNWTAVNHASSFSLPKGDDTNFDIHIYSKSRDHGRNTSLPKSSITISKDRPWKIPMTSWRFPCGSKNRRWTLPVVMQDEPARILRPGTSPDNRNGPPVTVINPEVFVQQKGVSYMYKLTWTPPGEKNLNADVIICRGIPNEYKCSERNITFLQNISTESGFKMIQHPNPYRIGMVVSGEGNPRRIQWSPCIYNPDEEPMKPEVLLDDSHPRQLLVLVNRYPCSPDTGSGVKVTRVNMTYCPIKSKKQDKCNGPSQLKVIQELGVQQTYNVDPGWHRVDLMAITEGGKQSEQLTEMINVGVDVESFPIWGIAVSVALPILFIISLVVVVMWYFRNQLVKNEPLKMKTPDQPQYRLDPDVHTTEHEGYLREIPPSPSPSSENLIPPDRSNHHPTKTDFKQVPKKKVVPIDIVGQNVRQKANGYATGNFKNHEGDVSDEESEDEDQGNSAMTDISIESRHNDISSDESGMDDSGATKENRSSGNYSRIAAVLPSEPRVPELRENGLLPRLEDTFEIPAFEVKLIEKSPISPIGKDFEFGTELKTMIPPKIWQAKSLPVALNSNAGPIDVTENKKTGSLVIKSSSAQNLDSDSGNSKESGSGSSRSLNYEGFFCGEKGPPSRSDDSGQGKAGKCKNPVLNFFKESSVSEGSSQGTGTTDGSSAISSDIYRRYPKCDSGQSDLDSGKIGPNSDSSGNTSEMCGTTHFDNGGIPNGNPSGERELKLDEPKVGHSAVAETTPKGSGGENGYLKVTFPNPAYSEAPDPKEVDLSDINIEEIPELSSLPALVDSFAFPSFSTEPQECFV